MATPAVINNSPGNLRDPNTGNFQTFTNPLDGKAALYNDLTAKMTGNSSHNIPDGPNAGKKLDSNSSVLDFARVYAPTADHNDPVGYAAKIANKMGISPDTPIGTLLPRIEDFASAISSNEDPSSTYQSHQPIEINNQPGSGYNPKPFSSGQINSGNNNSNNDNSGTPTTQNQSPTTLGGQLGQRANDIGQTWQDTYSGKINPLETGLQTVGAVAGGLGDVVNKGLELIPGMKWVEGEIGNGAQAFFNTSTGQKVAGAIGEFQQAHPELSKDLEAGFNIATAIPIFEGLGTGADIGKDAVFGSSKLLNLAKKWTVDDFSESLTSKGAQAMSGDVPDLVDKIIQYKAPINLVNQGGVIRRDLSGVKQAFSDVVTDINNNKLQPILEDISAKQNFGQPIDYLRKIAINEAEQDSTLAKGHSVQNAIKYINNAFDDWKITYGNSINLATENGLKIGSGKFAQWGTYEGSADKAIYSALQHNIEDVAAKNGYTEVSALNKEMGGLLQYLKKGSVLDKINGTKVVNRGLSHQVIKGASIGAGAAIGGMFGGGPIGIGLGGLVGKEATGMVERGLEKLTKRDIASSILKRTVNPIEATVQNTKGKLSGLLGAALSQKAMKGVPLQK